MPFWNGNPQGSNGPCNCTPQLQRLNQRIDRMEREINRMNRRIDNLERFHKYPTPMPFNAQASNFTSNEEYPEYQSGNYMI